MNPMNDDSELTFGGYDTTRFEGSLTWHPVIDQLFWSLNLEDVRIGDKSLGICQDRQCFATPDSGTSLSTMPSWALSVFNDATYEHGMPCVEGFDMSLEDLVFVIDGVDYPLPSHHWNSREIDTSIEEGGKCFTTLSALDIQ